MTYKKIITLFFLLFLTNNIWSAPNSNENIDGVLLKVNLLNQTPDPVRAGEIVELRFGITNQGNIGIENLQVTLDYTYPFELLPGEETTRTINKIYPFQSTDNAQIIKYKLLIDKDTPNGKYEISLKLKKNNQEITSIYKFNISISAKEYAQIITINKANVDFGVVEKLDFLITNTGHSPLKNIVFSWSENTETLLPVNSDNTKYIKYLEVGESTTITYNVMANSNSSPGLYKLNLNLNFENEENTNNTINTVAGIFIGGETNFDLTFAENNSGTISLSIANIGNNPAYSINLIIPEQENYTVTGPNSTILGNLDKGDYTIASFNITSKRSMDFNEIGINRTQGTNQQQLKQNTPQEKQNTTKSKINNLKILVEYTDAMGQRQQIEKEVNIETSSNLSTLTTNRQNMGGYATQFNRKSNNLNWYGYVIIGILVLVVGFYSYKFYTKKKKQI